jgi:hypothetical protein
MPLKPRVIEQMIEEAGLQVVEMYPCSRNSSHTKVRVRRASDGRESIQVFASTPSDHRAMSNRRADLRRFAKGLVG